MPPFLIEQAPPCIHEAFRQESDVLAREIVTRVQHLQKVAEGTKEYSATATK
jgi:phage shock protein A